MILCACYFQSDQHLTASTQIRPAKAKLLFFLVLSFSIAFHFFLCICERIARIIAATKNWCFFMIFSHPHEQTLDDCGKKEACRVKRKLDSGENAGTPVVQSTLLYTFRCRQTVIINTFSLRSPEGWIKMLPFIEEKVYSTKQRFCEVFVLTLEYKALMMLG